MWQNKGLPGIHRSPDYWTTTLPPELLLPLLLLLLHFILLLHTFTDETQWLPDKVQVADDSLGSSSSPDQQTMKSLSSSAVNWCGWGLTRHRCCLKVNNLKGEYRKNKGNGAVQG